MIYQWNWQHQPVNVSYEITGSGSPLLLLPAFSTISNQSEMRQLAQLLADNFQVVTLDWPGFGNSDRHPFHYDPTLYHQFLSDFMAAIYPQASPGVVAAGHAAGYVLALAQQDPTRWSKIVLVAPTWRGPLPTVMGERRPLFNRLKALIRTPGVGQSLYQLTTTPVFLGAMMRRHVYGDPLRVTPEWVESKRQTTQHPGARFAASAFVTGGLDPVHDSQAFLALSHPCLVVIGHQTPPKSRTEMEAIAHMSGTQAHLMNGSLSLHDEYPEELSRVIRSYLGSPMMK